MTNVEPARNQVPVTGLACPSRRMILRNGLLVGAGVVAAGAMSVGRAGSAQAAAADPQAATADPQGDWAWCSKCQGLYYVNSEYSVCPYGAVFGRHGQLKSFEYFVFYQNEGNSYWQTDWAWCQACAGLFFSDGQPSAGSCPSLDGYGPHLNSGWNYTLGHSGAVYSGAQDGWFHCSQCQGIFFGDTNTRAGVCPLDNSAYVHNGSGSFAYIMIA
jgi:hypothetical protein